MNPNTPERRIVMLGERLPGGVPIGKEQRPRVAVAGIGGAGINLLERVSTFDKLALTTDIAHLRSAPARVKMLIDRREVESVGTADISVLDLVDLEGVDMLRNFFSEADIAIVVGGFGGTTFGPLSPYVARIARKQGCLTFCIGIMPFRVEGEVRMRRATYQQARSGGIPHGLITLSNESLLSVAPSLPASRAFDAMNAIVCEVMGDLAKASTISDIQPAKEFFGTGARLWLTGSAVPRKRFPRLAVEEALGSPWLPRPERLKKVLLIVKGSGAEPSDALEFAMEMGSRLGPFDLMYGTLDSPTSREDMLSATLLVGS